MKKLIYSMFALAMMATTFNSCEDVPAPYDLPGTDEPVVIEPTGNGTLENPFNVAAALAYVEDLAADVETTQDIYIKGKVASITTNYDQSEPQFGNAVFYISDDGTSTKQFYVYRALYLGNKRYTSGTTLQQGDEVVICGKLVNYRGTTPETVQSKAFLYSLNGVTEGGGSGGGGGGSGEAKAVTIAEFNAAEESNTQVYELVGTIGGNINTTYGNFDLTDETGTVYVYGLTAKETGYGATNDQSYASLNLKRDDKIKIRGYRGSYNGRIEVMYAWFVEKLADGGSGGGGDDNTFGKLEGNVLTLVSADLKVENGKEPGVVTLVDGTKLTFDGGGNTNTPKYYTTGVSIRMYPKNSMTITAKDKKIASVTLTCSEQSGTLCNASEEVSATPGTVSYDGSLVKVTGVNNASVVITNSNGSTGTASQLRFATLVITYAE